MVFVMDELRDRRNKLIVKVARAYQKQVGIAKLYTNCIRKCETFVLGSYDLASAVCGGIGSDQDGMTT